MGSVESFTDENEMFECEVCNFKTTYRWNLKRHMKQHTNTTMAVAECDAPTDKPVHVCHNCGKTLQSKTGLNLHVRRKHTLDFALNLAYAKKVLCPCMRVWMGGGGGSVIHYLLKI